MTDPGPTSETVPARERKAGSWSKGAALAAAASFLLLAALQVASVLRRPAEDIVGHAWVPALVAPENPRWTLRDPLDGTERALVYLDVVEPKRLLVFAKGFTKGMPPIARGELVLWMKGPGSAPLWKVGTVRVSPSEVGPDLVAAGPASFRDVAGFVLSTEESSDARAPTRIVAATRD